MVKFEIVKKYADCDIDLIPKRSTINAAGYDMVAAEDKIILPYLDLMKDLKKQFEKIFLNPLKSELTLDEMATVIKTFKIKPTLISTGVKVYLNAGQYLKLVSRSSFPLKYWLTCANGVGIIDADYADNRDNEGEIFFQAINMSPFPIKIHRGEKICQGIIQSYITVDEDNTTNVRMGGFGSTGK